MRRTTGGYLAAAGLLGLIPHGAAFAQTLSTVRVASGLSSPVAATHAPGDTGRMFIAEQGSGGTALIKVLNLNNNTVQAAPFLSLSGLATGGEQGLLGLAFHPDYPLNGKFYVNLTIPGGAFGQGVTQIREYTAIGNPLTAVAANPTPRLIMQFDQPQTNHNGGWLGFNPKLTPTTPQYLYIATGDGGAGNDQGTGHIEPGGNAQNLTTVLGKMLRVDVNSDAFPGDATRNYAIPPTNPFAPSLTFRPEIWAYGLRNPWRASFDRQTGDLYIGDVGQGLREEVNFQPGNSPGGENYQWRLREGTMQTPGVGGPAPANSVGPIHDYPNPAGGAAAAVVGGHVFRGDSLVGRDGHYFFADTYNSQIWVLDYNGAFIQDAENVTAQLDPPGALTINTIVSFGEDALGRLYIVDLDGEVYRIVPEPASAAMLALAGCTVLLRRRRR